MKWINDTILSMGGMQSCGYTLEKISEDEDGDYAVDNGDDGYDDDDSVDHCDDDDDDKGDVDDDANKANSQSPYSHHLYSTPL